jgi:hypothetical protein
MFRLVKPLRAWVKRVRNASPFENLSGVPINPHWLIVQWGYIAVVFMALLVTTIPMAIGSPSQKMAVPTRLENARSEASCDIGIDEASRASSSSCEIKNQRPSLDSPAQSERVVPVIPLRPRNERGGESVIFLRSRPPQVVKG